MEPQPSSSDAERPTGSAASFTGSAELLRCAAQSLADAGQGDLPNGAGQSVDDEIRVLSRFCNVNGLWMANEEVEQQLAE